MDISILEQYIRENLAKGYAEDDLTQAIRAQGAWSEDDIHAALGRVHGPRVPAMSQTERSEGAPSARPDDAASGVWQDETSAVEHDAGAGGWHGSIEEFAAIAARKRRMLAIASLVSAVVVLAGVGGYLAIWSNRATPEDALLRAFTAAREIESIRYHATTTIAVEVDPKGEAREQAAIVIGQHGTASAAFTLTLDGALELNPGTSTLKHQRVDVGIIGSGKGGPFNVSIEAGATVAQIPPNVYVTLTKMPKFPGFFDLTFLSGRAIVFPMDELEKQSGADTESLFASGTPALFGGNFDVNLLSDETRAKLGASYRAHAPVVISETKEDIVLPDASAREYVVHFDRPAFGRFIAEARVYAPEFTEGSETLEAQAILDIFASTTGKFVIEKKTYHIRNISLDIPFATTTDEGDVEGSLTFDVSFDGINEPVVVTAPSNALSWDDFTRSIEDAIENDPRIVKANPFFVGFIQGFNGARTEAQDAKRINDLNMIQLALELSFDEHQQYPMTLNELVPKYLPSMPMDPVDEMEYVYAPFERERSPAPCNGKQKKCQWYVLGAALASSENRVLVTDSDLLPMVRGKFSGSDTIGCRGEEGRSCYDVSP